jgi:hypothetical protein
VVVAVQHAERAAVEPEKCFAKPLYQFLPELILALLGLVARARLLG